MSGLTLRFKAPATERITLDGITPSKLAALSSHEIGKLNVGIEKGGVALGDAFDISGSAGDTLTIEGATSEIDFVGGGLDRHNPRRRQHRLVRCAPDDRRQNRSSRQCR
ncbi:hypothetical protein [Bradyrhizobium sp. RDI18]|uniref:hypothetical protein n=1 Tax=Bradyrhizobium sp. RDI18 TaxID=3367400 RepID=UPI003713FF77